MSIELDQKFPIEHAIGLYALSYAVLPAWGIYEYEKIKAALRGVPDSSHIYLIGETPKLTIGPFEQDDRQLLIGLKYLDVSHTARFPLPPELNLQEKDGFYFLADDAGNRHFPDSDQILGAIGGVPFEVLYVGQAFGKDGERKALDRLISHKRLQEIAIRGPKTDHELSIILLELAENMLISRINPVAKIDSDEISDARIKAGVDKLFGTTLAERVSLYEAALIRYFRPKFNIEFKDSFPSTNLKILQDAYAKDFAGLVAEINFDDFPYQLFSDEVEQSPFVMARFPLIEDSDRKVFFSF